MPLGDKSGPNGQGPMTGRRLGFCTGNDQPGYTSDAPGRGFGMGRGMAYGRGFGRGRGYARNAGYENPPMSPKAETNMLKAESKRLEDELKAINGRIDELEK
ncbi:MAG: DUF5320 domain-containing protein [Bacteroidales bacterium]